MEFNKILLLAQNALGDVILTTGFAKAVREQFPYSRLAFLCAPFAAELCHLSFIDDMIPYTKGMPLLPVIRRLWRFDVALCLDFKYRSAVIPFLARVPVRAGIAHKRRLFMTHYVDRNPNHEKMYFAEHLADIVERAIGLKIEGDLSRLYVADATPQDKLAVDNKMKNCRGEGIRVAVAPFSSSTMKDWPIERYKAFMETLTQRYKIRFYLIGGATEAKKSLPPFDENVVDLRGCFKITETAELLRRMDYFVGNCSAPLHIATAVNLPCLAFYGPGSVAKWAPRHKCITLSHPQSCTPCDAVGYGKPCNFNNVCIQSITMNEALDGFEQLVRRYPAAIRNEY